MIAMAWRLLRRMPDDDGNAARNAAVNTSAMLPGSDAEADSKQSRNGRRLASPEVILAEIDNADAERLAAAECWVTTAQLDAHLSARLKGAIAQRRRIDPRRPCDRQRAPAFWFGVWRDRGGAGAARINRTGLDGDSARADHADPT